jgi:glycosyltransferase involved in cell wall biosynthesis
MFYAWTPADAGVKTKTVHRFGIGILHLVRPIARWGWRQTLRRASLLICATPQHAKALQAEHPQSKVIDLPVIVAPPPGSLVQREPFGQSTLRLALVGTLADYRRPLVFCQLVHRLRAQGIPASGTIIGSGPMRAELEQFCNQNGLSDVIRFLGKIPTAEVLERVREADLLVNLCVVEAYGRNVIEAMAVGTPAVCAASAGPADLIEDNVDGLLVRPPVAEEYARRIAELWRKPALWEKLSAAALRKTLGWWPDAVLDRLESAMIELVASRAD